MQTGHRSLCCGMRQSGIHRTALMVMVESHTARHVVLCMMYAVLTTVVLGGMKPSSVHTAANLDQSHSYPTNCIPPSA